ncbi:SUKH-3 domain-containing protein [Streptomyces sp. NPDC053429]|uniref:SUKH-3 domain-containing protein n=1 Tax=Streptomyces sp. NPDC053429 TaxID=3365702 RepID=UPI0037D08F31
MDKIDLALFTPAGPGGRVLIQTRRSTLVQDAFPDLVPAASQLPGGLVLDGEVLAWELEAGDLPFEGLQRRAAARARNDPAPAAGLPAPLRHLRHLDGRRNRADHAPERGAQTPPGGPVRGGAGGASQSRVCRAGGRPWDTRPARRRAAALRGRSPHGAIPQNNRSRTMSTDGDSAPPVDHMPLEDDGHGHEASYRVAARAVLREAGWTPGRSSGPGPAPAMVDQYGPPSRAVREFLAEYGGLHLLFTDPRDSSDDTDIDICGGADILGWVGTWSRAAGEPVFPVGEFGHRNCVLLVGDSGSLYGAFDAVLGRLGADALTGLG